MAEIHCRHFNGYKPCGLSTQCDSRCTSRSLVQNRILIVHLGALGAVTRSTSLLSGIHRKYPNAHVTWVTESPADAILRGHPKIDRVLTLCQSDLLSLSCLEFDFGFCIDKSLTASGVLRMTKVKKLFGFRSESSTGSIVPANDEAHELWEIGLSDHKKFFDNKKAETQLIAEAIGLEFTRDEYDLPLSQKEILDAKRKRESWLCGKEKIVGINTGCSGVIPYKKLSVDGHRRLIRMLHGLNVRVVLLGGPEDTVRNQQISHGMDLVSSSTQSGIRDGITSIEACDIVISGDSFGMHLAIARKKWVVAWFGPTCAHEIDLYDRGVKVLSEASCSPCWKRQCQKSPMCYDLVDFSEIVAGVKKGMVDHLVTSIPIDASISLGKAEISGHARKYVDKDAF